MMKKQTILITRPAGRADALISKLNQADYNVIHIPCLEINYPHLAIESAEASKSIDSLNSFTKFIFVSVNAVIGFFKYYANYYSAEQLQLISNNSVVFAIGHGTASELQSYGIENIIYPKHSQQENSENFVQLKELQNIQNDKILLIRGDTSREYLNQYLLPRCKQLVELVVYQGDCPAGTITASLLGLPTAADTKNLMVLVTSNSILQNFYNKLDDSLKMLLDTYYLLVPSERVAIEAQKLGFKKIYCTNSMNDEVIIDMMRMVLRK